MYSIKRFKNFLNEKTGVSDDVERFSMFLYEYVNDKILSGEDIFYLPTEKIPKEIVNYKDIEFFKIIISYENGLLYDNSGVELYLNKKIKLSIIEHEIIHLYQSTRSSGEERNDRLYYEMNDIRSYYDKIMNLFNKFIYYSLDSEIDARTQQVFKEIKEMNVNKENFIDIIKDIDDYKLSEHLIKSTITVHIKKEKDIVKFVSHWLFFYKNRDILLKKGGFKRKVFDVAIKIFGIKPNIIKRFPVINKLYGNLFYEEVSYEYADKFLSKWEKVFKKQGKKLKRKLIRLYNNIE